MARDEPGTTAAGPGGDEALRKQHYKLNRDQRGDAGMPWHFRLGSFTTILA
jgi:hypothetical protein